MYPTNGLYWIPVGVPFNVYLEIRICYRVLSVHVSTQHMLRLEGLHGHWVFCCSELQRVVWCSRVLYRFCTSCSSSVKLLGRVSCLVAFADMCKVWTASCKGSQGFYTATRQYDKHLLGGSIPPNLSPHRNPTVPYLKRQTDYCTWKPFSTLEPQCLPFGWL